MKKSFKTLLIISSLPFLVGCGGGKRELSEQSSADSSNQSETVKITFWHTFGQTIVDGLSGKIADFVNLVKENDGVDVEIEMAYQGNYDDIEEKVRKGFAVSNIPTITVAYPDHVADYLEDGKSAGKSYVCDLDKYIEDENIGFGKESWLGDIYDETDFVPDFFNEGSNYSIEGTYSLPFMKSTEVMFYNMDQLKVAMRTYKPEFNESDTLIEQYMNNISWDEFMNLCKSIYENKDDISNMLEVPAYYDSDANFFITKMYQNDIPFASISDSAGVIDFASGEAKAKTISLLEGLWQNRQDHLITTKGIVNKYGSDYFTNEKCVFSIGSSGGAGYNFPQSDAFDLRICKVPASNNKPYYVSQGPTLCIMNNPGLSESVNELRTKYAFKFIKYITNGKLNAQICVNGSEGYVPVRTSAYETTFFQEFMEEGEKYAKCYDVIINDINVNGGYLVTPTFKGSAALRDECGSLLTAVFNATSKDQISGLIDTAVSNARLKM